MTSTTHGIGRRELFHVGALAGAFALVGGAGLAAPAQASPLATAEFPFTPNQQLLDAFMARRGGPIGTGGKPAIAFRCDHHLNKFQSLVLPLHQKYSIPVTIAAMSQMFKIEIGSNGSNSLSYPALQKLALENGLEIANHGGNHQDAPTDQRLREEIVYSRAALTKFLPLLPIELFTPPGVAGTRYGGFDGGRSQYSFQRYIAGRLITQQHAMSTGYEPGYWPMTGNPLHSMGNVHIGLETAEYIRRGPSFVQAAKTQGRGVCFMYHPSLVDSIDLAALEDFFAWCANERDAGRLEIFTTTGLMMSSFNSSSRHNLLSRNASFKTGWNGWNGAAAKWAIRNESGFSYARRGSSSTALSKDVPLGVHAGSVRQLRIPLRSTTGVRVQIEVLNAASGAPLTAAKDLVLPKSTVFKPLQQYLIIPLTGTSTVRVRITPRTGGELHVQEPQMLAA